MSRWSLSAFAAYAIDLKRLTKILRKRLNFVYTFLTILRQRSEECCLALLLN